MHSSSQRLTLPAAAPEHALFALRVERVRLVLIERAVEDEGRRREAAAERGRVEATLRSLERRRPRDARLAARLRLPAEALDFFWTAVALEVDPRVLPLAERLVGEQARRGATVALHAAAFDLDGAAGRALTDALDPARPVVRAGILVPAGPGQILAATPFRVPARVRAHLLGRDGLDAALCQVAAVPPDDDDERSDVDAVARALEQESDLLVAVEGPSGVGKGGVVARAAAALGRQVIALDAARWDGRAAIESLIGDWWRECVLAGALPAIEHLDELPAPERRRVALLVDEIPGPVAVTARQAGPELRLRRPLVRVQVPLPAAAARRRLWQRELGADAAHVDLDLLAQRYRTGAAGIARAVTAARLVAAEDAALGTAAVAAGVRTTIDERIGDAAVRVSVTQGWDELVLPDDTLEQIRALVARVRHAHLVLDQWGFGRKLARGQGVAALLSGPPGTGKTMVAGLVARELELDLLQVDLSRVVSKWIGETEKQLGAVFDAAEAGHSLLLFDEADALFARRTEVKGANDRYANLEVNYLLQRIEAFGGITLLTTNFETAIDPAVRRRLAAHIAFWPPGDAERALLWRKALPAEAPLAGPLDHDALALAFPQLTGAHIRNAAVAAAFYAASDGGGLGQEHLERAARVEYQAMGRILGHAKESDE